MAFRALTARGLRGFIFAIAGLAVPGFLAAATITVTSAADTIAVDGGVTLREAITSIDNQANVNSDVVAVGAYGTADTIQFAIGSGIQTIHVTSALPALSMPVVIDATTQPGFSGTPLIELDGSATPTADGILIGKIFGSGSPGNSTIRGLAIGGFASGVHVAAGDSSVIAGNFLGLDATRAVRSNGEGVLIYFVTGEGGPNNVIGGTTPADRNVISGNLSGVSVGTAGCLIEGNYIGTDPSGSIAVPNGDGIDLLTGTSG